MNIYPIQQYCQYNQNNQYNKFTCSRYVISLIGSILITLISTYYCFKTYKNANKFVYELIPMALCILQGLIHLIQFSILNENHLTLLGNLTQIIIFSIVGYAFSLVYKRQSTDEIKFTPFKRRRLQLKELLYLLIFALQLICISLTKTSVCNTYFYIVIILTIIDILITMSIIIYYGRKLQKVLVHVKNRFSSNKHEIQQNFIQTPFFEADLPKEKIHQIQVVVLSITFNTMLYIIIVLTLFVNDKNLLCNFEYDDKMDVKNNIMLFIFTATQLFPCYIVPYAFNYRLKETSNNDDGLEFTKERAFSSRFQIEESNDVFVQRLTKGRTKYDDELN